jgi:hypothetical protein
VPSVAHCRIRKAYIKALINKLTGELTNCRVDPVGTMSRISMAIDDTPAGMYVYISCCYSQPIRSVATVNTALLGLACSRNECMMINQALCFFPRLLGAAANGLPVLWCHGSSDRRALPACLVWSLESESVLRGSVLVVLS